MRILAVDDKALPRSALCRAIGQAAPDAELVACANGAEVLARQDAGAFDVAFLDIDMPGMNGIELARELKRLNPKVNVVFATGYGEYAFDAFALRSSGYLLKPITADAVATELDNLRFPPSVSADEDRLVVQCFGNFEVFAGGRPLEFKRAKSKELLAYIVDRCGAVVRLKEAEAVLWGGDEAYARSVSGSYLRTLITDLRRTLARHGYADVLIRRRGEVGVDVSRFSCDYYDFLAGVPLAVAAWHGEYMEQYSWAEVTKASLLRA